MQLVRVYSDDVNQAFRKTRNHDSDVREYSATFLTDSGREETSTVPG